MQVQVATKDVETGEESIFTIVGSEVPSFYFSWEIEGVVQKMMIDKASAHMIAEALRRTSNTPEKPKAKTT